MGIISSIAGLAGSIGGGIANNGDEDAAKDAYAKALEAITGLKTPDDMSDPIVLDKYVQAGLITPEMVDKISLLSDAKNEIVEDPEQINNQKHTLNALKDMSQTGLTATDRAAFNKLRSQTASDTQAKVNQILQQQQMQGKASGGNALAAQLSAIQGSNQNASAEADRLAAAATEARRSALTNFGNMAGDMRNQGVATQKFNAENEIARKKFLDNNSTARQTANVAAQNDANLTNTNRQQSVSDKNVSSQNSEYAARKQREQQVYDNQYNKAMALKGIYNQTGDRATQSAINTAQNWTNMGQAAGEAIESLATGGGSYSSGVSKAVNPTGTAANQISALDNYVMPRADGGIVGTDEGKVPVDSFENDKELTVLSPGEIVIPKSFAHDPDLSKAYINFIHKHKKKT